jgi:large repetitive protein
MTADITYDQLTLPDAYLDQAYYAKVATHGAASIITASSVATGALPTGLSLGSAAGAYDEITGTPSAAGVFTFTLSLTDSAGAATSASATLTVYGSSQGPTGDTEHPLNSATAALSAEWPGTVN